MNRNPKPLFLSKQFFGESFFNNNFNFLNNNFYHTYLKVITITLITLKIKITIKKI